jgi:roadblock/LC7 domain-containing protein
MKTIIFLIAILITSSLSAQQMYVDTKTEYWGAYENTSNWTPIAEWRKPNYSKLDSDLIEKLKASLRLQEVSFCNIHLKSYETDQCISFPDIKFPGGIGLLYYDSNRKLMFEVQYDIVIRRETGNIITMKTVGYYFDVSNTEAEKIYKELKEKYKEYLNSQL